MFNKILVVLFSLLVVLGLAQFVHAAAQTNCYGYSPTVVAQDIAQHAHESAVQRMADKANAKRSDGIGVFISVILTALLSSIHGHKDENESFFDNERAVVSITVAICIIMAVVAIIAGASIVPTKEECWPVCQSNSALGTVISLVLVAVWNFVCKHGKVVSECPEGATFELFGAQANLDDRMNDLLIFHRWICIDDEAERTSAVREAWAAIKANITSTVKHAHNDVYACAYPTLDELETTDIAMLIDAGVQVHVHCSVHGEQLVDPDYYQCTLCCAEEEQRICDDYNVQVMMVALSDVCSAVDADNSAAYKIGALALNTDPAVEQAVMQWHMRLHGMYDTTTKELPAISQTVEEEDWCYACLFEAQGDEWQSKYGL